MDFEPLKEWGENLPPLILTEWGYITWLDKLLDQEKLGDRASLTCCNELERLKATIAGDLRKLIDPLSGKPVVLEKLRVWDVDIKFDQILPTDHEFKTRDGHRMWIRYYPSDVLFKVDIVIIFCTEDEEYV